MDLNFRSDGNNHKLLGLCPSEVEPFKTIALIDSPGGAFIEHYIEDIKLLLRPLSSMTEEEGACIGEIVYGKPDSVKWRIEHRKGYVKIYRKHYSNHLCIDYASGDVDFYDDNGIPGTSIHATEIFRHLLTKGFDVFGLE